jgi:hypothetical protein
MLESSKHAQNWITFRALKAAESKITDSQINFARNALNYPKLAEFIAFPNSAF